MIKFNFKSSFCSLHSQKPALKHLRAVWPIKWGQYDILASGETNIAKLRIVLCSFKARTEMLRDGGIEQRMWLAVI